MSSSNEMQEKHLSLDYWGNRWLDDDITFHQAEGHAMFQRHIKGLLIKTFGDNFSSLNLRTFVPLCGKSKDMLFLYNLGLTVVGAEFSRKAAVDFFAENEMKTNQDLTDSNKDDTAQESDAAESAVTSEDGRLKIVVGDLFSYNSDNLPYAHYDVIWDRGSFVAINLVDRDRYAKLLTSLMEPKTCLYLMSALEYPKHEYGGPPKSVSRQDIEKHYNELCTLDVVEEIDSFSNDATKVKFQSRGISRMTETMYQIKLKKDTQ